MGNFLSVPQIKFGAQTDSEKFLRDREKMKKFIILGMMLFVIWSAVTGCAHVPKERQVEYPPPPSYDPVGPVR